VLRHYAIFHTDFIFILCSNDSYCTDHDDIVQFSKILARVITFFPKHCWSTRLVINNQQYLCTYALDLYVRTHCHHSRLSINSIIQLMTTI